MCGIAGIYGYHYAALDVDRDELRRMRDHMATRGPDGAGEWFSANGQVALGHRRLSIIDLSDRASQPMISADGKHTLVFNGEIYNHAALRRRLETKGYRFRTESDTEVLLHLYADRGEAMLHDLRGMFAFALWDDEKKSMLLARDPYGIKPLYYADDGWTFRFASQVKALLAGGRVSRDPEPAGLVGFYLFGNVPEPYTRYLDVRALPAGAYVWIDRTGARAPTQYFSIAQAFRDAERDPLARAENARDFVSQALLDSVRHHLVADVPVGIFLSAGVDSGALLGLMAQAGADHPQAITLAFDEYRGGLQDETEIASQVAKHYGARHTVRVVTEKEFHDDLPKILHAMDQPSIDGINTWFVTKSARELGLKVALSGLGGDELFGGYPSFKSIPRWTRTLFVPGLLPFAGEAFEALAGLIGSTRSMSPKSAALLKYGGSYAGAYLLRRGLFMPSELEALLDEGMVREGLRRLAPIAAISALIAPAPRSAFGKVATLEAGHYMRGQLLRDADWASMAHSVELRVPLVDSVLLRQLARALPELRQSGKRLLAQAPSQALPPAVLARRKTGFTTPVGHWLQRSKLLREWRANPALAQPHCPWARRWAYEIMCRGRASSFASAQEAGAHSLGIEAS